MKGAPPPGDPLDKAMDIEAQTSVAATTTRPRKVTGRQERGWYESSPEQLKAGMGALGWLWGYSSTPATTNIASVVLIVSFLSLAWTFSIAPTPTPDILEFRRYLQGTIGLVLSFLLGASTSSR